MQNISKQTHFGVLIATLRRQKFDPLAGKVWSQSRLAEEADLSLKIVGDIERGRRVNIDEHTLVRLADALNLSILERHYFYQIAASIQQQYAPFPRGSAIEYLQNRVQLMAEMQLPAFIHDSLFNLMAANQLWLDYYTLTDAEWDAPQLPFNLLRMTIDPSSPVHQQLGTKWREMAQRILYRFCAYSMPEMPSDRYRETLQHLMQFKQFRGLWVESIHQTGDHLHNASVFGYTHPRFGTLRLMSVSEQLVTNRGSFYLSIMIPGNTTASKLFDKLSRSTASQAHQLWPFPKSTIAPHE